MTTIFKLLVVMQLKHLFCDYVLQSHPYFIGKFRKGWDFVGPMAAHTGLHGCFTFLIAVEFGASQSLALALAAFDFAAHFAMDRLKAGERYMGRWKALSGREYATATPEQLRSNVLFWQALGIDQCWHHLCNYAIIWMLVR